jgi:hypothetical protein
VSAKLEDTPEYALLLELKRTQGTELMQRYGANALGIGWKRKDGEKTGQLALIFYVDDKQSPRGQQVPPSIRFTPKDAEEVVELPTDVIESPPAQFE